MRVELRKKYPYFGLYKLKISIYQDGWDFQAEHRRQDEVRQYLNKTYTTPEEYKWHGGWNIYLINESIFDDVNAKFPDYINYLHKPAPGYENLEGIDKNTNKKLWYDKYPYKVVLSVNRVEYHIQDQWCVNNLSGNFKTSTRRSNTSFYFMNAFDATAFKLTFGDILVETFVANFEKAAIILEERMNAAAREYYEYLEGERDGE